MIDKRSRKKLIQAKHDSEESPHVILIEMEGVLVDSDELLYEAFSSFLKKYSFETTKIEFYSLKGLPLAEMIHQLNERYGLRNSIEKLVSDYYQILKEFFSNVPLKKEAESVLQYAYDQGFSLNLISTFQNQLIKPFLQSTHIIEYFDAIITTDETVIENIPNLYQKALDFLGVDAEETIAIIISQQGMTLANEADIGIWHFGSNHAKPLKSDSHVTDWAAIRKKLSDL